MAIRKVIRIDEEKCNGCGLCVPSCAEGAIQIVDGKAKLVSDTYCDGLGACLGECPEGALTIEERDADSFDEEAAKRHVKVQAQASKACHQTPSAVAAPPTTECGCPGARVRQFSPSAATQAESSGTRPSELRQWPVQLHLLPPTAPFFQNADVLLVADCVAYSLGDFHKDHLKGKALAIACPKLDQGQEMYLEKLVALIDHARINTLTVMIMQVPCCAGLLQLAKTAASRAQRKIPIKRLIVGLEGQILSEDWVI